MNLDDVMDGLSRPFEVHEIKWKPQITTKKGGGGRVDIVRNGVQVAGCVAHIDARQVMDRLDAVVGPGGWSDSYSPAALGRGVECQLTVLGVTKTDVGVASQNDPEKGAYSDAFKRAAVKFGIGRHLYDMPIEWLPFDGYKILPQQKRRPADSRGEQSPTAQAKRRPNWSKGDKSPQSNGRPDDDEKAVHEDRKHFASAAVRAIRRLEKTEDVRAHMEMLGYAQSAESADERVIQFRQLVALCNNLDAGMDQGAAVDAAMNSE